MNHEPRVSLAKEHEVVLALSNDLLARAESGEWRLCDAVWDDFTRRLEAHMELEEKQLFPKLVAERPECQKDMEKLVLEHQEIRATMNRLGLAIQLHELRERHVRDLVTKLEHHAKAENQEFYPWLATEAPELDRPATA